MHSCSANITIYFNQNNLLICIYENYNKWRLVKHVKNNPCSYFCILYVNHWIRLIEFQLSSIVEFKILIWKTRRELFKLNNYLLIILHFQYKYVYRITYSIYLTNYLSIFLFNNLSYFLIDNCFKSIFSILIYFSSISLTTWPTFVWFINYLFYPIFCSSY